MAHFYTPKSELPWQRKAFALAAFLGLFTALHAQLPTVVRTSIAPAQFWMTAQGEVTNEGGSPVIERGFVWGTASNPTVPANYFTQNGTGSGSFSTQLAALTPSTTYYIRPYARNTSGYAYGPEDTITTVAIGAEEQMVFWNFFDVAYSENPTTNNTSGATPAITLMPMANKEPAGLAGIDYRDINSIFHAGNQAAAFTGSPDSITIAFISNGYEDIKLKLDYLSATATSFDVAYSLDGVSYTNLETAYPLQTSSTNWGTALFDFSSINALEQKTTLSYIKIFNFSNGTGPFRIDNVELFAISRKPTIFLTPSSLINLNYAEGTGPSDEQELLIEGLNLKGNLQITGFGTQFQWSSVPGGPYTNATIDLVPVAGSVSQSIYVVMAAGLTTGNYSTTITASSLDAPSIAAGLSGRVTSGACSELFISQYALYTGNSRAIEIYNPSFSSIDLSTYSIQIFANGSPVATQTIALSGSIPSFGTFVIANPSGYYGSSLLADLFTNSLNFDGNDAVVLVKGAVRQDIIGRIGEDPGTAWTGPGISTTGYNLIRKSSVSQGVAVNPVAGFPTLSNQWIAVPINDNSYLTLTPPEFDFGTHLSLCKPSTVGAQSDIVIDPSFVYAQNILHKDFLSPAAQTSSDWWDNHSLSVPIAGFVLRDGGGMVDDDLNSTNLNFLSLEIGGGENLDSIAIFTIDEFGGIYFAGSSPAAPLVAFQPFISANDGDSARFYIAATFKPCVTDNTRITVKISGVNTPGEIGGSSDFLLSDGGGATSSTAVDNNRIEVVATKLNFTVQPTNTVVQSIINPAVVVQAQDTICNNVDLDYNGFVTLSLISLNPCTGISGGIVQAINGTATFTNLRPQVASTNLQLVATSNPVLTGATSNSFDVTSTAAAGLETLLAEWNFTDGNPGADDGIFQNLNPPRLITDNGVTNQGFAGCGCLGEPIGNVMRRASGWNTGGGNKYWIIAFTTAGYNDLRISSVQSSAVNGPRDFELGYSLDGSSWTTIPGSSITVGNNYTTGVLNEFSLPSILNDRGLVYIRWRRATTTSVSGGAISSSAYSYIDNIIVKGKSTGITDPVALYAFRTFGSGLYSDPCNWQSSIDGLFWDQAPAPPNNTSDVVSIRNGHTITLDVSDLNIDQLVIDNGGQFILQDAKNLTLLNGVGVDMQVNGTFVTEATAGNEMNFAGSVWTLGATGSFIKTSNGSSTAYRDNYSLGIANIPATSNWILRKTGTLAPGLLSAPPMTYGNLIIEDQTGLGWDMLPGSRFNSTTGTLVIKGKLDVGGSGTGPVVAYHEMTNASHALQINDSLIVRTGSVFTNASSNPGIRLNVRGNLLIDGTLNMNNGVGVLELQKGAAGQLIGGQGDLVVQNLNVLSNVGNTTVVNQMNNAKHLRIHGNLSIPANQVLTNDGASVDGYGFELSGNASINGTFQFVNPTNPLGRVLFSGSANQTISGSGVANLHFVQINKPSNDVLLDLATNVTGQMTFTSGLVTTNATNRLTFTTSGTHAGASISSYINGPVYKAFNNNDVTFEFPVGKKLPGVYKPFKFVTTNANAGTMEGEYFPLQPDVSGGTFFDGSLLGILKSEYWQLNRSSGSSLRGRIILNYQYPGVGPHWLQASTFDEIDICNTCNVAVVKKYAPGEPPLSASSPAWDFTRPDNFFAVTEPIPEARFYTNNGEIISSELENFSPFTIGFGYENILGVLPLRILDFYGKIQGDNGYLSWRIDDSKDLQHFVLEHSTDSRNFTPLAQIQGNGRSYNYLHTSLPPGINYYRLRVIEKDGTQFYSKIIQLAKPFEVTQIVGLTENPPRSQAYVRIQSASDQDATLRLISMNGAILQSKTVALFRGQNIVPMEVAQLAAGVYLLHVETGDGKRAALKFVK